MGRFSFSFLILAGLLVWQMYKADPPLTAGQKAMYIAGAVVFFMLGMVGVRMRHMPTDPTNRTERDAMR